jgi:hypothetical protein
MMSFLRIAAAVVGLAAAASAQPMDVPADLPRYDMEVRLDIAARKATVRQKVTFTNTFARPAEDLAFHVYPRYRVPPEQYHGFSKLAQFLLIDPTELIDKQGRRATIHKATLDGRELPFSFHPVLETILTVKLPAAVRQGESVTVVLDWELSIPDIQGHTCHWRGVTNLVNWYPILCAYTPAGWATVPFVPWHRPYYAETGVYDVRVTLPEDQVIGGSGEVLSESPAGEGWKTAVIRATARDFGLICSNRFKRFEAVADGVKCRVLAFPEHEFYAQFMLQVMQEVFPLFNRLLGRYPFAEFEIIECYFGHLGNQGSGFIMIEQRVFAMPWINRRYVDNLVSHETLHQWWYNLVGANCFNESWMEEGITTHLTNFRMRQKYGLDSLVFTWPRLLEGLPNVGAEDLSQKGYYKRMIHGRDMPIVQPMHKFGDTEALFDFVYDKGGHVAGMIHYRMGDDEYFRFLREIQAKYRFRVITVEQFRAELERFTGKSWKLFFAQWVFGTGVCDWAIDNVGATGPHADGRWRISFDLVQRGPIYEPVNVGIFLKGGGTAVVRVDPERALPYRTTDPPAAVERVNSLRFRVTATVIAEPQQVEIDPRLEILDPFRHNNRRYPGIEWRLSPLYITPDDDPIFNPFHKLTVQWAPSVENDMENNPVLGWKAGIVQSYVFRAYSLNGYSTLTGELVSGGRADLYKLPVPNMTLGVEYVRGLTPDLGDRQTERGRAYLRYSEKRFTSVFNPEPHFIEAYAKFVNTLYDSPQFAPPGIDPLTDRAAVGVRYHRDTRLPYWDPIQGTLFNVGYEAGGHVMGATRSYHAVSAEFAAVQKLPDEWGCLGRTKLAARLKGAFGAPDDAQIFAFGGPRDFRGLFPTRRLGNAYWLAGVEWRFPVMPDFELQAPFIDEVFLLKKIDGSVFYEVGDVYQNGAQAQYQFDGGPQLGRGRVSHGIGAGIFLDVTMFGILDRVQFRVDIAKDLSSSEPPVLWFRIDKAF